MWFCSSLVLRYRHTTSDTPAACADIKQNYADAARRNAATPLYAKGQLVVFKASLADSLPDRLAVDDDDAGDGDGDGERSDLVVLQLSSRGLNYERKLIFNMIIITFDIRQFLNRFMCQVQA